METNYSDSTLKMGERVERPLVVTVGDGPVRDWSRRRHCADAACIGGHGDEYCSYPSPEGLTAEALVPLPALEADPMDLDTLLPPRALKTGRRADRKQMLVKSFKQPVKYPFARGCGHQFVELQQPRHRNCETCWNAFFWNQNEMTENVARNVQEQGPEIVQAIHGKKFLTHFLRFAILLARYEHFKQNPSSECAAVEEEKDGTDDGPQQHQATD